MEAAAIREEFCRQVSPSLPNDWEIDEAVDLLGMVPTVLCRSLLSQVGVIWPISHSLCLSFLAAGVGHAERLPIELLGEWVRQVLYWYELQGLGRARAFMDDFDQAFLAPRRGDAAVTLAALRGRLLPYLRGLAGAPLNIGEDEVPWTDGEVVFLPPSLHPLTRQKDNEKLYTFLLASQWGYLTIGSLDAIPEPAVVRAVAEAHGRSGAACSVEELFLLFPEPDLAEKIFHLLEFGRMCRFLGEQLPGLWRSVAPLLGQWLTRLAVADARGAAAVLPGIIEQLIGLPPSELSTVSPVDLPPCPLRSLDDSFTGLLPFYRLFAGRLSAADFGRQLPFLGKLAYAKAGQRRLARREEDRQAVTQLLAGLLMATPGKVGESGEEEEALGREEGAATVVTVLSQENDDSREPAWRLRINTEEVRLPDQFSPLADRIVADLGHFPEAYTQSAVGMAGAGRVKIATGAVDGHTPVVDPCQFTYDEWDFRRQGYRKNWCSLRIKELSGSRSSFPDETLVRYRGVLGRLRRQFEALRSHHRFTRRNRFGDDIDFDALVEAMGDRRAGRDPSERLFIRLHKSERDIATLFLIDMSNSTEGWVGKAIKEALVLLCEAMAAAGDRYGAYGFSGMRRSRCDLFHIKHLDEAFSEAIHDRIGAIMPREYTRMGAPIRHLTRILAKADARSRLLIVLSDGKPEDYDDYVGDYAIEDTRKALVEARGLGIHPFCITIDQQAQEYLPHMYGQGNYIVIKEIAALPRRLGEMYRLLTS